MNMMLQFKKLVRLRIPGAPSVEIDFLPYEFKRLNRNRPAKAYFAQKIYRFEEFVNVLVL